MHIVLTLLSFDLIKSVTTGIELYIYVYFNYQTHLTSISQELIEKANREV